MEFYLGVVYTLSVTALGGVFGWWLAETITNVEDTNAANAETPPR